MIDPYTKAVLAVILVALVAINLNHTIRPANAHFSACGDFPCWVQITP